MSRELIERKCIVEGTVKPVAELLRFVELNNALLPDFNKKLPGKGMYVTGNRLSLTKALEKKLFNKASRHNLKIAEGFAEMVEDLIKQKALDSLNLARKAGALVTGFEKVKEAVKKNKVDFMALNKENTVHLAVLKSDMSRMVYNNLKKYQNFLS